MATIRTKKAALAEAVRRWGKRAAVQDRGVDAASTSDARATALADLKAHREGKPTAPADYKNLDAWPDNATLFDYRRAWAIYTERFNVWRETERRLQWDARRTRYAVGEITIGFLVHGQGDSWDDAFANASTKGR